MKRILATGPYPNYQIVSFVKDTSLKAVFFDRDAEGEMAFCQVFGWATITYDSGDTVERATAVVACVQVKGTGDLTPAALNPDFMGLAALGADYSDVYEKFEEELERRAGRAAPRRWGGGRGGGRALGAN